MTKTKIKCCFPETIHTEKKKELIPYYLDAFDHIRALTDLEWNGSITVSHFRERVNDIISVISKKESQ